MKNVLTISILLVLLLLVGCGTQEPKEEIKQGFLTRTYTSEDENSSMKITINNIDNTGSVETTLFIPDKDEWQYSLKEGIYTKENFSEEGNDEAIDLSGLFSLSYVLPCEMLWGYLRDYDATMEEYSNASEWTNQTFTDEETKEQEDFAEFMKGFKATKFSIKFIDKEDKSTIMECYNVNLGKEDALEYRAYNTTTQREIDFGEEAMWGDYEESSESNNDASIPNERTEFASCVSLGCDEKHIAVGDKSTSQWYYCDCFGVESIAQEDRTCFSSIDVAEAVGYYQAWDCE